MRILVTGASGFLGSYLVGSLLAHDHRVAMLLRKESNLQRIRDVATKDRVYFGSIDHRAAVRTALQHFRPDAIAHMAWRGVANTDRNAPLQAENIVDTLNLLADAADHGVRAFVAAGSQAEYGPYNRAISEDDEAKPTTLYGMAKLATYQMGTKLASELGLRFAWLRVFSTYGPGDNDCWLLPQVVRTLKSGKRMSLTGCEQQWGFLHARDAAEAFRIALESNRAAGIFNVGSADAPSLRDTLETLRQLINSEAELGIGDIPYRPDQVMILKAEIDKLRTLGWSPSVELRDGLEELASSYD
jgi:nucleoside-diphosphate-sugar epimerase